MADLGRKINYNTKFLFTNTVILRDRPPIGHGSFGEVLYAQCDNLLCAAKCVHKILFDTYKADNQQSEPIEGFLREYQYLSSMSHPNIVQYLGYHYDEKEVPFLLMELMDESLTHYLESLSSDVPFHKSINFMHDISMGLEYLHHNDVLHCDLSSHNVLLLARYRAKISDFGLMSLVSAESDYHIRGKLAPGTLNYMPPEATNEENPNFGSMLDVFSLGVLMIQMLTREWPMPSEAKKVIMGEGPAGTGRIIPVSEIERRRNHLSKIDKNHPLRIIAEHCIKDEEYLRPNVSEVCERLAFLKELPEYHESKLENPIDSIKPTLPTPDEAQTKAIKEMDGQIKKLKSIIENMDSEAIQMKAAIDRKDRLLEQSGIREGTPLSATVGGGASPNPSLSNRHSIGGGSSPNSSLSNRHSFSGGASPLISSRQSPMSSLGSSGPSSLPMSSPLPVQDLVVGDKTLKWYPLTKAPHPLYGGSAITIGGRAYVTGQGLKVIYEFNPEANSWATLPSTPFASFALVSINGTITTVGGFDSQSYSNCLYSLVKAQGDSALSWQQSYPPMKDSRISPAVGSTAQYVVVAGGDQQVPNNHILSNSVEILDIHSKVWTVGDRLPRVAKRFTLTISGDTVFALGGITNGNQPLSDMFFTSLQQLVQESAQRGIGGDLNRAFKTGKCWQKLPVPVVYGTCAMLNGRLVLVGGWGNKPSNAVYTYDPVAQPTNPWRYVGQLPLARMDAMCTVLPGNRLVVIGGRTQNQQDPVLSAAEIACPV